MKGSYGKSRQKLICVYGFVFWSCETKMEGKLHMDDYSESNLSELLSLFLNSLKDYTYFDYHTKDILFVDVDSFEEDLMDQISDLIRYGDLSEPDANKYKNYIKSFISSGQKWFDVSFMPGVTGIEIRNRSDFNCDERSHRGDCLPNEHTIIAKRVKVQYDQSDKTVSDQLKDNTLLTEDLIYEIDTIYYQGYWEVTGTTGLTWGDILMSVLLVKGSKSDWWYELMTRINAKVENSVLVVSIEFDHGS